MKLSIIAVFLLFSVASNAQRVTIQEDKAKISFNFTDQDVDGELSDFKFVGSIQLDTIETASISGSVATETLDTNNWLRSRHLRGKKYFSADMHPRLSFKSNSITETDRGFRVSGQLTIKGITQDVIWDFTKKDNLLTGTASINTHDYDIFIYDEKSRNEVIIKIILPYTL